MGWVLRLVEIGVEGSGRSVDVMEISRPSDLGDIVPDSATCSRPKPIPPPTWQWLLDPQSLDGPDVKDAEWIAELVRHGLVSASFVPPPAIAELRDLTRYRRKLVEAQA